MRLIALLASLLCPLALFAQPLADRVPADATLYIAWQGMDNMGPGYQQSNLKGLLDSSDFQRFVSQMGPGLSKLAQKEGPEAVRAMQMIGGIVEPLWRNPTAIYFVRVNFDGPMPTPQLAIISRPGKDADNLHKQLQALVAEAKKQDAPPFPFEAFRADDIVGIQIGFANAAAALAAPGKSIATADKFKQAIAAVHKEPLSVAYLDAESLFAQIDKGIGLMGDPQAKQMWPVVRDALGLTGLKHAIATSAFDQKDWSTQFFIAAPAPRQGLLALIEPQPVSDELLKSVPATATWFGASHFDVDRLLTQLRAVAAKIDPNAPAAMDQGLAQARQITGVDLQKDLFAALGQHWAFYSDPQTTGNSLLSMVIVNKARKPAELQKSLDTLAATANRMIAQEMRGEDARFRIAQAKVGDISLSYMPLPFIAPAWGMKDGSLYVGLYPQMVAAAASAPAGKSILDNPDFIALRKRLSPGTAPNHIVFMNLPQTAGDAYPTLLAISQLFAGVADMAGMDVPPLLVPPLPRVRQFLSPAGSAIWVDDQGLHGRGVSPFPGAEMLASQGAGVFAVAPIMVGIAMPAVATARHQAQAVQSMSNLRQVGVAVMMYEADNGKFPADLGALVEGGFVQPQVFIAASSGKQVPPGIQADPKKGAAWVKENSDYIYLAPKGRPQRVAETILAYEKPEVQERGRLNILFADGHVEALPVDHALERIEQQAK